MLLIEENLCTKANDLFCDTKTNESCCEIFQARK